MGLAGQTNHGQLVAERIDPVGVEERFAQFRRESQPIDEPGPCLMEFGRRPVLVDTPDHLGRLDQGIVGS